ncbi:MAG TPA: hypothetical protein VMA83_00290 [Solirubrobacteraceae bacterium]|nr:hypothetical protein [Solirubrobacteraceae bacterium]
MTAADVAAAAVVACFWSVRLGFENEFFALADDGVFLRRRGWVLPFTADEVESGEQRLREAFFEGLVLLDV